MGAAESAPVVGLRNDFGTSCYLNALLQCLASSSRVTVAAGELAVLQENLFSRSLARVLHLLQPCNRGRDRDEVHERVMELQKQSASRIAYCVHQEDAHELFQLVVFPMLQRDAIAHWRQALAAKARAMRERRLASMVNWSKLNEAVRFELAVGDLLPLSGVAADTLSFEERLPSGRVRERRVWTAPSVFSVLSLPLSTEADERARARLNGVTLSAHVELVARPLIAPKHRRLTELLEEYFAPHQVEYRPEGARESVLAAKQLRVLELPPVLCLHLNRILYLPHGAMAKDRTHVPFPSKLRADRLRALAGVPEETPAAPVRAGGSTPPRVCSADGDVIDAALRLLVQGAETGVVAALLARTLPLHFIMNPRRQMREKGGAANAATAAVAGVRGGSGTVAAGSECGGRRPSGVSDGEAGTRHRGGGGDAVASCGGEGGAEGAAGVGNDVDAAVPSSAGIAEVEAGESEEVKRADVVDAAAASSDGGPRGRPARAVSPDPIDAQTAVEVLREALMNGEAGPGVGTGAEADIGVAAAPTGGRGAALGGPAWGLPVELLPGAYRAVLDPLWEGEDAPAGAEGAVYRLVAVLEHLGSAYGGHYVAYRRVQRPDSGTRWYRISDSLVREVEWRTVRAVDAFMLFYELVQEGGGGQEGDDGEGVPES